MSPVRPRLGRLLLYSRPERPPNQTHTLPFQKSCIYVPDRGLPFGSQQSVSIPRSYCLYSRMLSFLLLRSIQPAHPIPRTYYSFTLSTPYGLRSNTFKVFCWRYSTNLLNAGSELPCCCCGGFSEPNLCWRLSIWAPWAFSMSL